jgi:3-hydroxybutyryl-CoA dehydratase
MTSPATEIFEEGIVPTKQRLGGFQLRARVLVGDINANWKWAVRDYPIDIAKYHQETGTVGGSAGLVMVTEIGKDLPELGQMKPGDIGIMLSGKHDVLTTEALGGSAQAHRSFRIHAYEAKDALEGSYSQEVVLDWSQFVRIDEGAYPFEDLGGVGLVYPTVEHAWNVLNLKKGSLAAMEGAIGATGGPGVQTAKFREASVIGIVSSTERGRIAIETYGSETFIDRTKHLSDEEYVTAIKERVKELTGHKRLLDKVLAYSGQGMFRKHVLSVREADPMSREDFGGEVAYFGAGETGFALEIPGTGGDTPIEDMFERVAKLRRERYRVPRMRRILIIGRANEELRETIEIAKKRHSDVIVVVFNREDEETVKGWNLLATTGPWPGQKTHDGIVNLQVRNIPVERMPDPPRLLPDHPTPEQVKEFQQCSESYAAYQRRGLIPFGKAIGAIWGVDSTGRPLGPDVDFVLVGGEDGENILNYLKFSGFFTQIAYPNDTSKMTLRWHGALGWMNQNSIVLTKKAILGAHYASPSESAAVIDWIMRGAIRPAKARWFWPAQIGVAQEGIGTGKNVILVGVSRPGLKTLDEAYESQEIHPLIARLSYGKAIVREQAAEQIYERGLAMAREALEAWGQDAALKPLVFGPPVVGVAVEPERFAAIRDAWNEPELAQVPSDQDVEEFEISVRGAHLDILTPKRPAAGEGVLDKFLQKHGENIQQVELWTSDVVKATEILIDRARQGLGFKPIYEVPRPGANGTLVNFTLFSLKDGRKLLVELVQLVPGVKTSQPARIVADTDVRAFAKASGDRNPFHLDNGYAQASRYGTRIAHGVLTASLVLASLERFAPGHALSAVEITKFTAPVKISDAVIPQIEVIELNNGSMRLKIGAVNQDGKPLFEGQVEVKPRVRLEHAVGQTAWTEPGQLLRWAQAWARDVKPFEVRPAPDFQVGDHGTYRGDLPESQALHITEETFNAARALFGDANPHLNELIGIGAVAHTSAIFAPGYILMGARAESFSKPIKVGDTLTAQATVTDLQTTKSGKTIIKISIEISNQRGDHVLTGEVTKIRADETAPLSSKN